jgi:hypothetical protein
MFTHSVKILRQAKAESTRKNVIQVTSQFPPSYPHCVINLSSKSQTLTPLLKDLLSRPWNNYTADLTTLLTGSVRGDVFTDLVSAIDISLASASASLAFRRKALQLALVIVSSVGQNFLAACFLRRDFFSTIVKVRALEYLIRTPALTHDSMISTNYSLFQTPLPQL